MLQRWGLAEKEHTSYSNGITATHTCTYSLQTSFFYRLKYRVYKHIFLNNVWLLNFKNNNFQNIIAGTTPNT